MSTSSLDCLIVFENHALLHLSFWEILFPDVGNRLAWMKYIQL